MGCDRPATRRGSRLDARSGLPRVRGVPTGAGASCPRSTTIEPSSLAGGLISYGPEQIDQYWRAAGYIDRIFRGEKPADLPVQVPTSASESGQKRKPLSSFDELRNLFHITGIIIG
jgi:hypothetical protein